MAALVTSTSLTDTKLGELEAGWSVSEQATPVSIAGQNAGTGSVSFSAQSTTESVFAINDVGNFTRVGLGSVDGVVGNVTVDDLRAKVSQGTLLTRLNADLPEGAGIMGATGTLSSMFVNPIRALIPGADIVWASASNPTRTYPVWRGNVWDHLNQLCAATAREIVAVGNQIIIRDVGSTVLAADNFDAGGKASLSIDTRATGRKVEVVYQNATQMVNGEMYSARADDNRQFQVNFQEQVTVAVVTNAYPTSLVQPRVVSAGNPYELPDLGTYTVSGSDGLPIPASEWLAYGGGVRVDVGDQPNVIDVTFTGPRMTIPGVDGPYRLGVSDGVTDYANLRLQGSGTLTDPKVLALHTGADTALATQDVATRVENPFIRNLSDAYTRGVWAADEAAGPTVTLTFTVPVSDIDGFGVTAGALFPYAGSIFRIISVGFSNLNATITGTRHVTAGDVVALWGSATAGEYADFWAGHPAEDATIRPLWHP